MASAAAGDVGMKRVENQLKIQQLESDALRVRLIDAETSNERRQLTLEHGTTATNYSSYDRLIASSHCVDLAITSLFRPR